MAAHGTRGEAGQASVELVALLPLIAVVCALAWQAVVAGQALWLAGSAARAAARAGAVGSDVAKAARGTLPASLERGLRVRRLDGGRVEVSVRIPAVAGGWRLASVTRAARFGVRGP